jgi:hypothetical protein
MNTQSPSILRELLGLSLSISVVVLLIVGVAFAFASHAASTAGEPLRANAEIPSGALSQSAIEPDGKSNTR